MSRFKVLSVIGTRPEAIKMAPIIKAIQTSEVLVSRVCATAQHRELLDPLLTLYGIEPQYDLSVMTPGQDLCDITSRVLLGMRDVLRLEHPDIVLVQGDTTTAFSSALAAFYARVPIGHIEAGLRTGEMSAPFPEESNRVLIDRLSTWYFAPCRRAHANLIAEGVSPTRIRMVGNTAIDALYHVRAKLAPLAGDSSAALAPVRFLFEQALSARVILVTAHRRENLGAGLNNICRALREVATSHPDVHIVFPIHLNPQVREPVRAVLAGCVNIHLLDPLCHAPFIRLLERCAFILTDSGGLQEEAPSLGKPVLVLRDATERAECLEAGTARLVGTDPERIIAECARLLEDETALMAMSRVHHPYGDGHAAQRIVEVLESALLSQVATGEAFKPAPQALTDQLAVGAMHGGWQ